MGISIRNVLLFDKRVDLFIEGNKFKKITPTGEGIYYKGNTVIFFDKTNDGEKKLVFRADEVIDGRNKAIVPAFYNLHCHAAMNILRGFCEDLPLFDWLEKIWVKEDSLNGEDIYNGTRLAILEMIKSGTVFFADMYWHHKDVIRAVEQMGIRADVGICFMDKLSKKEREERFGFIEDFSKQNRGRISVCAAPHAVYTCSKELYLQCHDSALKTGGYMQTHLCETEKEVADCKNLTGKTPVKYLYDIGVLDKRTIAAHCVHLRQEDAKLMAKSKTVAVHNPASNMKLSSGFFPVEMMKEEGCTLALGTDGASSNNNLSMIEEMKLACLLAKVSSSKADSLKAEEVFEMATITGAEAYGLNAGKIEEGKLADCILVDLDNERMQPLYNIIYNIVYSADSSCVDTVICDGKIVMRDHYVKDQEEIIAKARKYATREV